MLKNSVRSNKNWTDLLDERCKIFLFFLDDFG